MVEIVKVTVKFVVMGYFHHIAGEVYPNPSASCVEGLEGRVLVERIVELCSNIFIVSWTSNRVDKKQKEW